LMGVLRAAVSLVMLSYASIRDIQHCEVSDAVWFYGLISAAAFMVYELSIGTLWLSQQALSLSVMAAMCIIYRVLRLFGDADLLCFMTVTALNPTLPPYYLVTMSGVAGVFMWLWNKRELREDYKTEVLDCPPFNTPPISFEEYKEQPYIPAIAAGYVLVLAGRWLC